jgi:hypothetical protein
MYKFINNILFNSLSARYSVFNSFTNRRSNLRLAILIKLYLALSHVARYRSRRHSDSTRAILSSYFNLNTLFILLSRLNIKSNKLLYIYGPSYRSLSFILCLALGARSYLRRPALIRCGSRFYYR